MRVGHLAWCGATLLLAALFADRHLAAQPRSRDRDRARAANSSARPSESWLNRLAIDERRAIDFRATVPVDSVYVNEQVTWQAAVLINPRIRDRLRRNPEFVPPALQGVLAYDLGTVRRSTVQSAAGAAFEAYLFRRAMFPVAAGTLRIPSPQLSYRLPPTSGYFSREESYVVKAESTTVAVRPLPSEGRPADFTGAVGVYRISAEVERTDTPQGDPFLVTVRIEGVGNVALLTRPTVVLPWGTVVAGVERVSIDTSSSVVRGAKEFDLVVTPRDTGMVAFPALSFSFFDPGRASYVVATSDPRMVRIRSADIAPASVDSAGDVGVADAGVPPRPWTSAATQGDDRTVSWWWLLLWWGGFPLFALIQRVQRERRSTPHGVPTLTYPYAEDELGAAAEARRLRRLLLQGVAHRLELAPSALVDHEAVRRALRLAGVSRAVTETVVDMLERLATAGFAEPHARRGETVSLSEVEAHLLRVDAEAMTPSPEHRRGPRRRMRFPWLMRCVVAFGAVQGMLGPAAPLSAAPLSAVQPREPIVNDSVAAMVEQAINAYQQQDFLHAAQWWAQAVRQRPRDVPLLVNWGEAAWRGGDTVTAVRAWHRALREEPSDGILRERIGVLPPGARDGWAIVPAIDWRWLVGLGGLLWAIGWLWVARRKKGQLTSAFVLVILGAISASAGGWLRHRNRSDGIAVVAVPTTLRDAPSRDAGTVGGIGTGDLVRIRATREGWHQVALADGRTGWIPAAPPLALLVDPMDR